MEKRHQQFPCIAGAVAPTEVARAQTRALPQPGCTPPPCNRAMHLQLSKAGKLLRFIRQETSVAQVPQLRRLKAFEPACQPRRLLSTRQSCGLEKQAVFLARATWAFQLATLTQKKPKANALCRSTPTRPTGATNLKRTKHDRTQNKAQGPSKLRKALNQASFGLQLGSRGVCLAGNIRMHACIHTYIDMHTYI